MEEHVRMRIRQYLTFKSLTINGISKDSGYPQPTLNKQINGTTSISLKTILVILEYCPCISLKWLFFGEGEMESSHPQSREGLIRMYQDLLEVRDNKIRELEMKLINLESQKMSV